MNHSEVISKQASQLLELQRKVEVLSEQRNQYAKKAERALLLRNSFQKKYTLLKGALETAKEQAAYYQKKYTESRSIETFTKKDLIMEMITRNDFLKYIIDEYDKWKRKNKSTVDRVSNRI